MERRRFICVATSAGIAGMAGCTSTDDSSENGGDSENGDDGGTGDDSENGDGPRLEDLIRWENAFIVEVTVEDSEMGSVEQTIRFNGGNSHVTVEGEQSIDLYTIDEDVYMVTEEQCLMNPGQTATPDPEVDIEDEETVTGENPDLTPAGTDTIDGEEVYVYELAESVGVGTLYVSVETGYVRRVEFGEGTADYHSWGDVDPIEPPDMDCQEISGIGDEDGDDFGD